MKKIFLAGKGKRMLARFIDFLIMLACSAVLYFTAVYPNAFDAVAFNNLATERVTLFEDSGLYATNSNGQCSAKTNFKNNITKLTDMYDLTINLDGHIIEHNNLFKDLYIFYTTGLNEFYGGQVTFDYDSYCETILKVGKEDSNIASFNEEDYTITLIDDSKASHAIDYFLGQYEDAAETVYTSTKIKENTNTSNQMVINVLLLIIPVVAGFSFIFDGLVPFFAPYGQTIGKFITHLIVLTSQGHKVPKIKQLLRWLVYFLELAFGVVTFGGGILIPYTMFLFTKKRQAIHDYAAGTVVADGDRSIFYDNPVEEAFITNRLKEKGLDLDGSSDSSGTSPEE